MTPARPLVALFAFSVSVAAALVLAELVIRFVVDQGGEDYGPLWEPGDSDPVSPRDISALHEEVRRIQRGER